MEFTFRPIGILHTPFTDLAAVPIQSAFSQVPGRVELFPEYIPGLADLDGFSHIYLLYALHLSRGFDLKVTPFLDDSPRGLFSTRHPCRPNSIGLSLVQLRSIHDNWLEIEGADMITGTPLLDIKPFVPDFDTRPLARSGWYESRSKK